ncbi:LysR family transcriptional regulator [Saccharothrix sp. BKS2]|uniref:LysR family transcriptional regulator n=1 Tax=Saccharothrix sp. BKS2 TaxID=3064400 RepID=UPI0039ED1D34
MDTRLLRTFCTIARLRSFSAAARELGYTQSAVSQHVVALESDLGTTLLGRRPVVLTEAGERLLEHAAPILMRLDAARADVARVAAQPTSRLAVGIAPAASAVAPVVARQARRAGVRDLTLRVLPPVAVAEAVAVGDVDVGVVAAPAVRTDPLSLPAVSSLRATPLTESPALVAVPRDHPIAGRPGVSPPDLADARWIDAPEALGSLDELCATTGLPPLRVAVRCTGVDLDTLRRLLVAGEGLALLPAEAITPDLVGVPLVGLDLVYRSEVLHRREEDGVVAALVAALVAAPEVPSAPTGPRRHT